ncbi:Cytochrome c [compost metagenome]
MKRFAVMLALLLSGCGSGMTPEPLPGESALVTPIPGLNPTQVAMFNRGRVLFERNWAPKEGLGPLFNDTSCVSCHGLPAAGGGSARMTTLVAGEKNGAQLTLADRGAPMIQDNAVQIGTSAAVRMPFEQIPPEARFVSRRTTPPTFGDGLIEAIPEAQILAQLAADPRKAALGIRGIANAEFNQIGRFGWKSQKGDLVEFTQQASQFELGLSSPGRPQEHFPNLPPQKLANPSHYGNPDTPWVTEFFDMKATSGRATASPDLSEAQVADMVAFQRFQAPPAPLPLSGPAKLGETRFQEIGCAVCHTPRMTTGPNALGIPEGLEVALYSDLLVHDMGEALGDGLIQGIAQGQHWRSTPLWGLRFRERFLHDGRASTLEEAVQAHGAADSEARKVTEAYNALPEADRLALKAFLKSL